jgi:hypothetical protein
MIHEWTKETDGNGATIRIVLFDFRKAFDLIHHSLVITKILELNISIGITNWIIDFYNRTDCKSEWKSVPAGVPQGTKLGPWLFLLMIDDIDVTNSNLWKYVDDSTISVVVPRGKSSNIQAIVDEFSTKAHVSRFQLNEVKCKELQISFSKNPPQFQPIVINGKLIELVANAKLLGLNISNDLKWNFHIAELIKKVLARLYYLKQLKRASVDTKELLTFYTSCIRPIVEYACPVFHNSLPRYLADDIERLQKHALRIVFLDLKYCEALEKTNLMLLNDRRELSSKKLFHQICENDHHKLHQLLPKTRETNIGLRSRRKFAVPAFKTNRLKNTFIYSNCMT